MLTFLACLTNNVLNPRPSSVCNWEFVHREVEHLLCFTTIYYEDMNILGRFLQNRSPNENDLNFACMKSICIVSCFSDNRFKPPGTYIYLILYHLPIQRLPAQCIYFLLFSQWTANILLDFIYRLVIISYVFFEVRMTVNIHPTKAFHGFLSPTANVGLVQKSTLHFMLLMQSVALHASHAARCTSCFSCSPLHFMLLMQPSPKRTSNYSPK